MQVNLSREKGKKINHVAMPTSWDDIIGDLDGQIEEAKGRLNQLKKARAGFVAFRDSGEPFRQPLARAA
jgi:hypothetical protein